MAVLRAHALTRGGYTRDTAFFLVDPQLVFRTPMSASSVTDGIRSHTTATSELHSAKAAPVVLAGQSPILIPGPN